jgi:hypothetical protein
MKIAVTWIYCLRAHVKHLIMNFGINRIIKNFTLLYIILKLMYFFSFWRLSLINDEASLLEKGRLRCNPNARARELIGKFLLRIIFFFIFVTDFRRHSNNNTRTKTV